MKKLMNILTLAMMAFVMTSLTSCDDDEYIARTLEGTWKGDMYVSTYWNNQYYDAAYTEICFLRDPYTYASGDGYWVDYYDRGYWGGRDYIANHIYWTVDNRNIRIEFIEEVDPRYKYLDIYDYRLDNDYFVGSIYVGNQRRDFSLYHVASPNWGRYQWGYYDDYYDYYDYYYSNKSALTFSDDENAIAPKKDEDVAAQAPKRVFRERNDK